MTQPTSAVPTSASELLTTFRSLASKPSASMMSMLRIAEKQAQILNFYLNTPLEKIPDRMAKLAPGVIVRYVHDIPLPGAAFWIEGKGWHIHIRATDRLETQIFTLLHHLKQIIDHPLRSQMPEFSNADWDTLASHFASQVMSSEPQTAPVAGGSRHR